MLEKLLYLLGEAASMESEFIMNVTYPKNEAHPESFTITCYNGECFKVQISKEEK